MIRIAPTLLLFLPMATALALILGCALYYALVQRPARKIRHAQIYRCSVCRHVYVDERALPLARCPRCSCLNEAIRR